MENTQKMINEILNESSKRALFSLYVPDLGRMAQRPLLQFEHLDLTQISLEQVGAARFKSFANRDVLNDFVHRFLTSHRNRVAFNSAAEAKQKLLLTKTPLDYFAMQNNKRSIDQHQNSGQSFFYAHVTEEERVLTCALSSSDAIPDELSSAIRRINDLSSASAFLDTYGMWYAQPSVYVRSTLIIKGCQVDLAGDQEATKRRIEEFVNANANDPQSQVFKNNESTKSHIGVQGNAFHIKIDVYRNGVSQASVSVEENNLEENDDEEVSAAEEPELIVDETTGIIEQDGYQTIYLPIHILLQQISNHDQSFQSLHGFKLIKMAYSLRMIFKSHVKPQLKNWAKNCSPLPRAAARRHFARFDFDLYAHNTILPRFLEHVQTLRTQRATLNLNDIEQVAPSFLRAKLGLNEARTFAEQAQADDNEAAVLSDLIAMNAFYVNEREWSENEETARLEEFVCAMERMYSRTGRFDVVCLARVDFENLKERDRYSGTIFSALRQKIEENLKRPAELGRTTALILLNSATQSSRNRPYHVSLQKQPVLLNQSNDGLTCATCANKFAYFGEYLNHKHTLRCEQCSNDFQLDPNAIGPILEHNCWLRLEPIDEMRNRLHAIGLDAVLCHVCLNMVTVAEWVEHGQTCREQNLVLCRICMEPISRREKKLVALPCRHVACNSCVLTLLGANEAGELERHGQPVLCYICRAPFIYEQVHDVMFLFSHAIEIRDRLPAHEPQEDNDYENEDYLTSGDEEIYLYDPPFQQQIQNDIDHNREVDIEVERMVQLDERNRRRRY